MDLQPKSDEILPVTEELVTKLDEMIPEKCPDLTWTDREIWHYRGMRQIVYLLQRHLKERIEHSHVR